jgi:hypothetical protein
LAQGVALGYSYLAYITITKIRWRRMILGGGGVRGGYRQ